jgi:hypothetical protein
MTPVTKETTQPHYTKAAGSGRGKLTRDCGLIARLGWDLGDLSEAVYHTPTTVGSSLLVGEMLAGATR